MSETKRLRVLIAHMWLVYDDLRDTPYKPIALRIEAYADSLQRDYDAEVRGDEIEQRGFDILDAKEREAIHE